MSAEMGQARLSDVVRVKQFAPVIELTWVDDPERSDRLTRDYIVTEELAELFATILTSPFPGDDPVLSSLYKRRSHLITAQYGSGKTYFLLMLAGMLRAVDSEEKLPQVRSKFSGFPTVLRAIDQLKGRRFLVVHFSAKGQGHFPFKELLIKRLLKAVQEVRRDVILESEYAKAVEQLDYIAEKPVGKLFAEQLERQEEIAIDQLREGLLNLRPDFLHTYRNLYKTVVGDEPARIGLDLDKSLSSVLQEVRGAGYTDVAVVVDELTQYLVSSVIRRPLADTLGELENFAEFCNDGRNRYLFVAAMHRSLDRVMREQGMDPDQHEDHRKMRERFDDHDIIFRNYGDLLARIFEINEERFAELRSLPTVKRQLANLRKEALEDLEDKEREPPISAYFPLHPVMLRYLRGVTVRLGRETRTAFQFIGQVVRSEVNERPLLVEGRLNLFGPDELFDYFLPDIDKADDIGLVVAYNTTQAKLGDDLLAMRVFKCLAVQYINSTVMDLRPLDVSGMTIARLGNALNIANTACLKQPAKQLLKIRPQSVFYDTQSKQYWFGVGGEYWDIDSEIAKLIDTINPNDVLRGVLREESLTEIRGKVVMNPLSSVMVIVDRALEHEWHNARWLREVGQIPRSKIAAAKLVFLIPEFAERYDSTPVELREQAQRLSEKGVCIVLPRSSMMLNHADFRILAALRRLAESDEIVVHEQRMRIVNSRLEVLEDKLGNALGKFLHLSNYAFYIDRREARIESFEDAMQRLFHNLYPEFPRIRMESVSGRGVTKRVINTLIADKKRTLPRSEQSIDARFIRDAMPAMGLVEFAPRAGGQVASLTIPAADHDAHSIWREVVKRLGREHKPIESLYKTLMNPPYGLPDFLIEVYVSTYLALKKGFLIDLRTSRLEGSPSANLARLVTKHKDARFLVARRRPPVEALREFMGSVWKMTEEALGLRDYESTAVGAIDDQDLWFNKVRPRLPLYVARVVDPVRESLAALGIPADYIDDFRNGLVEVATSPNYVVPDKAYERTFELCKELPPAPSEAGEEEVDEHIAFYRLKALNDAWIDLRDDDKTGKIQMLDCIEAIKAIRQVTGKVVAPEYERLAKDAASKFKKCQENVFDAKARGAFVTSVHAWWESYTKAHQTEHDIIMQLRSSFGKDILDSPAYRLLEQLSPLSSQLGLRDASYFRMQVDNVCSTAHDGGQRAEFPGLRCPECGQFSLSGDSQKETETLTLQSRTLGESLWSATLGCLQKVAAFDEQADFQEYLADVEKREARRLWQHFSKVMQAGEGALRENAGDLLEVAPDLVKLIGRFWEYSQLPKPPVRIPADHLAEAFRQFLLRQGIAEYSFEELESKVTGWLENVKKERFVRRE